MLSSAATFGATLKFIVKDCDPSTGLPDSDEGYDDEYMLEDLEITVADQIQKNKKSNFTASWDSAATESKYPELKINSLCSFQIRNFQS